MTEAQVKTMDSSNVDALHAKMATGYDAIKSEIGEILKKMRIQPALAPIVPINKTKTIARTLSAVAKA